MEGQLHRLLAEYWYPLASVDEVQEGPVARSLLGTSIVLFLDIDKQPVALLDQCPHRGAKLSLGQVIEGQIQCPYHGWRFGEGGRCKKIHQTLAETPPSKARRSVQAFSAKIYCDHVWVCLAAEPQHPLPEMLPEQDEKFVVVPEFYELWQCDPFRICENELDLAHPAFVHTGTFGSKSGIEPDDIVIEELADGFILKAELKVAQPQEQKENTGVKSDEIVRQLEARWIFPLNIRLQIGYENGVKHVVCMNPVPQDGESCFISQFCLRNDDPTAAQKKDIVAFDRKVTLEDKTVLESVSTAFMDELDNTFQLKTDQPGLIIRKMLLERLG